MRPTDPIPMLPPMLRPRRRRSARPLIAGIVVLTVIALAVMNFVFERRQRAAREESIGQAEELFASGALNQAARAFELFWQNYPRDEKAELARMSDSLCKIAQQIDAEPSEPSVVIDALGEFSDAAAVDGLLAEKWPVILTLAERAARTRLERAGRSLIDADLVSGNAWRIWLEEQRARGVAGAANIDVDGLKALADESRLRIAAATQDRRFQTAAEQAIADPSPARLADFSAALHRRSSLEPKPDATVSSILERLRQSLRARVEFAPAPDRDPDTPPSPVTLPLDRFTLLSSRQQFRQLNLSNSDPVLVRVKDLCFGLEPDSGAPRWVIRVGYDAELPELVALRSRRAVLVSWSRDDQSVVSLANVATGDEIWSWTSDDRLAGRPVATRQSVYAATQTGKIWQLDLESGKPRRMVQLPEAIDGPPVRSGDGDGVAVVGAAQAVYLFDCGAELPTCRDVVLAPRRSGTSNCRLLWEPPYLLLFENDFASRCFVRVFHEESSGHRELRTVELEGRVWESPVLDGARMLLATDQWRRHCFGLDGANAAVNLFTAAAGPQIAPPVAPSMPRVVRVAADQAPFVVMLDELRGVRIDDSKALIVESWHRPPPKVGTRLVGPLQSRAGLIVATWQEPDSDGVLVEAIAADRGELIWSMRLGESARDLIAYDVADASTQLLARVDSGHVFLVAADQTSGRWRSTPMSLPGTIAPIELACTTHELVYASESGTRVRVVTLRDWSTTATFVQNPPARSPFTTYSGELRIRLLDGSTESRNGRWTAYVARDGSIVLRPLDGAADDIPPLRLTLDNTTNDWPWPPIVAGGSQVYVAHPLGRLARSELARVDGIVHLRESERRNDLPPMAGPPFLSGGFVVVVGRNGIAMSLDPITLKTVSRWQAASAVTGLAIGTERALVSLSDGTVVPLRVSEGTLAAAPAQPVGGTILRATSVDQEVVCVVRPSGTIMLLDLATGRELRTINVGSALSLPPLRFGDEYVLATADGALSKTPAPKLAPSGGD